MPIDTHHLLPTEIHIYAVQMDIEFIHNGPSIEDVPTQTADYPHVYLGIRQVQASRVDFSRQVSTLSTYIRLDNST